MDQQQHLSASQAKPAQAKQLSTEEQGQTGLCALHGLSYDRGRITALRL